MTARQKVKNGCLTIVAIGVILVVAWGWFFVKPNIEQFLSRAKMIKAEAEINSIETALTAALADAGLRDFRNFFSDEAFKRECDIEMQRSGTDAITASIQMYTTILPLLLQYGIAVSDVLGASRDTEHLQYVIRPGVQARLGDSYMDEIDLDPWGTPYQVFFGPWDMGLGTNVFRIYEDNSPEAIADALTVTLPERDNVPAQVGFQPKEEKPFYIWSLGQNRQSDQAIFDPTGEYAAPASQHYRPNASPEFMGGGDDINNWDRHRSYERFYRLE